MLRLVLLSTFAAGAALAAAPQQQQVFRVGLDTVPVYATVTDKAGRLVTDLTREEFQIFDNGKLQTITTFDNSPQPIRLIVLLDVSGSMTGNVQLVRAACEQLFAQLRPDDQVKVGTFGNEITIMPAFTNDIVDLRGAVPSEIPENAPTPLWRAVDRALGEFGEAGGRRVVLVLSDGKDSRGYTFKERFVSVLDVIDRAQREDVMVYAIGLHSRMAARSMPIGRGLGQMMADDMPDPELPKAAAETGGGYFEIRPRDDLGAAFARVADELHRQYLLGFTPPAADGKMHKIELKSTRRDAKPRARRNYQAPRR
jgi:Ca-activated chloride channel family protein